MKAMILAAGLGTRLRPLTDERPKALVEVGGRTLLEITLGRLRSFGIDEVIINVHHFADMVVEYLHAHGDFGLRIAISREDEMLLDTGGGLKKAADFFLQGDAGDEPFILHNVDVLSAIDLQNMVEFHRKENALATLAVQQRKSSRLLLFDAQEASPLQLCGRRTAGHADEMVCAAAHPQAWAFAGIHVLSPRIFGLMSEGGEPAFSIIPEYLRMAAGGEKIVGFRADGFYWRDLGTAASLQQAAEDVERKLIEL
ncbi:MAG: nucleotidyltransferase family protein [Candidatus Korobacteraceae bacterium]